MVSEKDNNGLIKYSYVNKEKIIQIDTHLHKWDICLETGNAYSVKKNPNFIQSLKKKIRREKSQFSIYDYFTSPDHIEWSVAEGKDFIKNVIQKNNIPIAGKRILDISGGNGHVANELRKCGATVVLTEINDAAIQYAKNKLNIDTYKFDFQKDSIDKTVPGKFDIVLLRAAVMFCQDLDCFLKDVEKVLHPGGVLVLQYCVIPTIGTLLRTQFDEYNYLVLYQPETLIKICKNLKFDLVSYENEIDPTMYVYDHDRSLKFTLIRIINELRALRKLPFNSSYPFRARDRRRSNLIFVLNAE